MDETVSSRPKAKTAAEYRAELAEIFREMDRLDAKMDEDWRESERLRLKTEATKARIDATLADIDARLNRLRSAG